MLGVLILPHHQQSSWRPFAERTHRIELSSQITATSLLCTVKLSVLLLYRRVFTFQSSYARLIWSASTVLVIAQFVAFLVQNLFQCSPRPLNTVWLGQPGQCVPNSTSAAVQGFTSAVTDIILLIIPIRAVWRLQMSPRMKGGVCGIFALGLMSVIFLLRSLQ